VASLTPMLLKDAIFVLISFFKVEALSAKGVNASTFYTFNF